MNWIERLFRKIIPYDHNERAQNAISAVVDDMGKFNTIILIAQFCSYCASPAICRNINKFAVGWTSVYFGLIILSNAISRAYKYDRIFARNLIRSQRIYIDNPWIQRVQLWYPDAILIIRCAQIKPQNIGYWLLDVYADIDYAVMKHTTPSHKTEYIQRISTDFICY